MRPERSTPSRSRKLPPRIPDLHHFHGERYHLGSYAIAGNHVHVLVSPHAGVELSSVIHSRKFFTSNAINKALGRSGRLWMDEFFDRLLRNQLHLDRVEAYIAAHVRQGAYVERRPSWGTGWKPMPQALPRKPQALPRLKG